MKKIILASLAASALLCAAETPVENAFMTHTELGYTNTSGNTDTTALALDFKGEQKWETFNIRLSGFAYYSEDSGTESKNQWGVEFNYDRPLTERLSLNYLANYKRDKFSGYEYRFTTGPGFSHKTIRTDNHKLTTQLNILYAEDKVEGADDKHSYTSGQAGFLYEWKIYEHLKFIEEATVRTELQETSNYIAYSKTSIQNKINSSLSMGLSYRIDYVNEPAEGKVTTDRTFLASLIIDY
jgi:putative salt-induced outer membrane protein